MQKKLDNLYSLYGFSKPCVYLSDFYSQIPESITGTNREMYGSIHNKRKNGKGNKGKIPVNAEENQSNPDQ